MPSIFSRFCTFIENHAKAALEQSGILKRQVVADLTLLGVDLREELGNLSDEVLREIGHRLRIRHYEYDRVESPYYIQAYDPPVDIEVQEVYSAQDWGIRSKVNAIPVGRRTVCVADRNGGQLGMFSTGQPQQDVATLDNYPALKLHK